MDISHYEAKRGKMRFARKIRLLSSACVGGKLEKQGPLGNYLDKAFEDSLMGEKSWEIAEGRMCEIALKCALEKAGATENNVDMLFAGDLLNQCIGSGYGLENFNIPYCGLYGACSTCAEGLMLASAMIDSGVIRTAAVVASSHFCSAERQFRFPLGYGSVSGPTAQTTVTGAGAFLLGAEDVFGRNKAAAVKNIYIEDAVCGIVSDRGIKDAGNMGAAMCTAAQSTLERYTASAGDELENVDKIITGDLGWEGSRLLAELLGEKNSNITEKLTDCGLLVYDLKKQDVGCGGSGCGCSAVVTAGYLASALEKGELSKIALVGTGAMMSPKSLKQGKSIPAVAHLVTLVSD